MSGPDNPRTIRSILDLIEKSNKGAKKKLGDSNDSAVITRLGVIVYAYALRMKSGSLGPEGTRALIAIKKMIQDAEDDQ